MLLLNFKKNSGSNQCWNLAIFILPIKPAAHYVTSTSSNEEWSFGWNGCLRKEARTNESTNEKNPNSQALGLNPVYEHHLHIHRSFCRGRWYTLALWRRGSHCVDHCLSPSSSLPVFSPLLAHSNTMVLSNDIDLLHPPAELEKRKHKLKRLVQSPNSFFMDVKCQGCFSITTVFSHSQTVVLCGSCSTVLCQPTGGRARLTEGCSFRKKGD